ncbi:Glutaredoxin [Candidatus Bilamarchaeum dharawalense]|uniref:Glutaredoxin n=1 Tax=Candidatus Bilamarchaeum dharawalense TaxID=2885759 RepID=A0A5E4LKL5_9ARCH|nr:Glutaredoxin [Candidatus Bilamarchaeum dharawalense]
MVKPIVYSTNNCPWCVKLKDFLKQNKIDYEERNASNNPEFAKEIFAKSGGYGVPVTDIDGTIIIGFNVKKIKEALKLS